MPEEGSELRESLDCDDLRAPAIVSVHGTGSPSSPSNGSDAGTGFTQLRGLVDRSSFHDEVLCQLMDAIHNRLIGEEAQKALIRAAKARVLELKDMKARGEVSLPCLATTYPSRCLDCMIADGPQEIMLSPPHVSTKPLKINKQKVSKAEEAIKSSLVPPPMTREPSSRQDLPSVLDTPTAERSPPASEGLGLDPQAEARTVS